MQLKPYFMTNKDWYYFDKKKWKYFLTDKAPQKAIESYENFYDDYKGKEIIQR